jgi:prolyl-tRNA synthetase
MVIPIQQKKEGVLDKACELKDALCAAGIRARLDDADKSPGWKFSDQEMRGIPVRLEIGPKDIEQGQCVIVRRDTRQKITASLEGIGAKVQEVLEQIQKDMFETAKKRMESMTYTASTKEEFNKMKAQEGKHNG